MELNCLKKLKKILLLSGTLTLGVTGCNNEVKDETAKITEYNATEATINSNAKPKENNTTETTEYTTIETEEETEEFLKNSTVDNIINQYNDLSGEMHSYEDFRVDRYDSVFLYSKGDTYVSDFHLCNSEDPKYVDGYTYIGDESIPIYVVHVKERTAIEEYYTPIAALTKIGNEYHNVVVTDYDGTIDREPSKHYINLDETKENYNNLENGEEYLYLKMK